MGTIDFMVYSDEDQMNGFGAVQNSCELAKARGFKDLLSKQLVVNPNRDMAMKNKKVCRSFQW